jgi:glutathione S-transferase
MSLTLHYHPLASYCWKVLIALYENETAFEPHLVDLSDAAQRAALERLWPILKFPVLRDDARGRTIAESSVIIEYLALHHPGKVALVPADPERAFEVRRWDRFFDLYVHEPMQKIVGDKLRPEGHKDPHGVAEARARLATAYAMLDDHVLDKPWAAGADFSMADCAAAPALHYADRVQPLAAHAHVKAYLERLHARSSFARVFEEAQPYMRMFPG